MQGKKFECQNLQMEECFEFKMNAKLFKNLTPPYSSFLETIVGIFLQERIFYEPYHIGVGRSRGQ